MKTSSQFFGWKRAVWDSEMSSGAKLVLMAISDHANQFDDVCWPGMERLALMCSRTVRSVSDYITEAVEQGWLTKWRRRQPKKQWCSTFYRLSVPEAVARQWQAGVDYDLADAESVNGDELVRDDGQQPTGEPPEEFAEGFSEENDEALVPPRSDVEIFRRNPESATHMQNFPTNTPRNRNTENLSISLPTAVNEEGGSEKEIPHGEQSDDQRIRNLANWMRELIRKLSPSFVARDFDQWPKQIESLRYAGRSIEQIAVLFRWANKDRFWGSIVVSPAKLNSNWSTLVLKRNADRQSRAGTPSQTGQAHVVASEPDTKFCSHIGPDGTRCNCRASVVRGAGSRKRGYCSTHARLYD